jgi:hypothetical protein
MNEVKFLARQNASQTAPTFVQLPAHATTGGNFIPALAKRRPVC